MLAPALEFCSTHHTAVVAAAATPEPAVMHIPENEGARPQDGVSLDASSSNSGQGPKQLMACQGRETVMHACAVCCDSLSVTLTQPADSHSRGVFQHMSAHCKLHDYDDVKLCDAAWSSALAPSTQTHL